MFETSPNCKSPLLGKPTKRTTPGPRTPAAHRGRLWRTVLSTTIITLTTIGLSLLGGSTTTPLNTVQNVYNKYYYPAQQVCYLNPTSNNFGDELGPAIVNRVLDIKFKKNVTVAAYQIETAHHPHPKGCLFGVGSVAHLLEDGDYAWGTGASIRWRATPVDKSNPNSPRRPTWCRKQGGPQFFIYAVRGQLTKSFINDNCGKRVPDDAPLGDPAMLLATIFPEYKKAAQPKHKVCVIPHNNDKNVQDQFAAYSTTTKWPTVHYDEMIRFIADCELVVSSSLHGIIVAEALGVPARWVMFKGAKTGDSEGTFKYNDYYSATGRAFDSFATSVEQAIEMGGAEPIKGYNYTRLLASFPYHLFQKQTQVPRGKTYV